jgi:hypothetical protein
MQEDPRSIKQRFTQFQIGIVSPPFSAPAMSARPRRIREPELRGRFTQFQIGIVSPRFCVPAIFSSV